MLAAVAGSTLVLLLIVVALILSSGQSESPSGTTTASTTDNNPTATEAGTGRTVGQTNGQGTPNNKTQNQNVVSPNPTQPLLFPNDGQDPTLL